MERATEAGPIVAVLTAVCVLLFLCVWIVVPGPVVPLFALGVGATEVWPVLAVLNVLGILAAMRVRGNLGRAAMVVAAASFACSVVPLAAYTVRGPAVPLRAFLEPWPLAPAAPAGRNRPVVLAIYGGAWQRGSPRNDAQFNAIIASWGYRVVALDYPHAPAFRWPAQREAVLRQIDALHGTRVVLLGHSSGSQLAMIAGALRPRRVAGIVTYASPVDLALGYEFPSQPDVIHARAIMSALCGGTPAAVPGCYRSASPRYVVHAGMPPVLMLAGARDHVVNLEFEGVLRDKLRADGVPVTYVELPWADHSFETVPWGFNNRIALYYVRRFLDGLK